jgi:hypothetical protein
MKLQVNDCRVRKWFFLEGEQRKQNLLDVLHSANVLRNAEFEGVERLSRVTHNLVPHTVKASGDQGADGPRPVGSLGTAWSTDSQLWG